MAFFSNYREFWIGIGLFIASMIIVLVLASAADTMKPDIGFVQKAFVGKEDDEVEKGNGRCPGTEKNKSENCADNYYCEKIRDGLIKQPASTVGGFGFIVIGLMILARIGFERANNYQPATRNRMTSSDTRLYPALYGWAVILMGPGSMMLHATMTEVGGFLDGISMYLWGAFFLAYSLTQVTGIENKIAFVGFYIGVVLACITASIAGVQSYFILAAVVGFPTVYHIYAIAKSRYNQKVWWWSGYGWFITGTCVWFTGAFPIWILSHTGGVLCVPDATFLQGHVWWHLLSAVMTGCVYLFYRAENQAMSSSS